MVGLPCLFPQHASVAMHLSGHLVAHPVGNEAPRSTDMTLRFKSAGLVRGNHKKTYTVPYEEINDPRFHWAEDYEI